MHLQWLWTDFAVISKNINDLLINSLLLNGRSFLQLINSSNNNKLWTIDNKYRYK